MMNKIIKIFSVRWALPAMPVVILLISLLPIESAREVVREGGGLRPAPPDYGLPRRR